MIHVTTRPVSPSRLPDAHRAGAGSPTPRRVARSRISPALVSTIFPKEDLGLVNFKHIHNAVLREAGGKLYIIAQAWNPGDFAVLEQVVP